MEPCLPQTPQPACCPSPSDSTSTHGRTSPSCCSKFPPIPQLLPSKCCPIFWNLKMSFHIQTKKTRISTDFHIQRQIKTKRENGEFPFGGKKNLFFKGITTMDWLCGVPYRMESYGGRTVYRGPDGRFAKRPNGHCRWI